MASCSPNSLKNLGAETKPNFSANEGSIFLVSKYSPMTDKFADLGTTMGADFLRVGGVYRVLLTPPSALQ